MRVLAAAPREERKLLGIILLMGAVTCFTMIDSCAKWLVQSLPPMEVVFVRYAGHLLLVLLFYLPLYGGSLFRTAAPKREFWRASMLLGSTVLNFTAVQFLPLATTASIAFTIPLWVTALSIPLLGEKVGPRRWAAIVIGFVGVLVVVRPGLTGFHWATLLSLGTALCASLYMIETRKLAGVDATATLQFYAALLATVIIAPFALMVWVWPEGWVNWTVFCMIGFWGWLGHQLLTIAYRYAGASLLAPFGYLQLLPMTLAGYLFFNDRPDQWVFIGAGIVVSSGLYVWYREQQLSKKA
jgi:drug/metabolite transporter (DMT)-like permease